MIVKVGTKDLDTSNKFLRSLWADLRKSFGKCAWQYTPYKVGKENKVVFGFMDINVPPFSIEVSINYEMKGQIKTISFNIDKKTTANYDKIKKKIEDSVNRAKVSMLKPRIYHFKTNVKSFYLLSRYEGASFSIVPCKPFKNGVSEIVLSVYGYDDPDAQSQFLRRLDNFIDIISIETNCPFWSVKSQESKYDKKDTEIQYMENETWIDGYPVQAGFLLIRQKTIETLDKVSFIDKDKQLGCFIRAGYLFHTARKIEAQVNDLLIIDDPKRLSEDTWEYPVRERDDLLSIAATMGKSQNELATVLYISALEVASLVIATEQKNCTKCGQPIYAISKRVRDFVGIYGSEYLPRIINDYYQKRSKIVHIGNIVSDVGYMGISMPQLDPNDDSGCKRVNSVSVSNLREYTGYCIRKAIASQ
ncbi:MAG: hypothetical protein BWY28_01890 [bacterium ADurb.Bin236]|nr:MAG: hypothetical protein BWY28_01890 [bacterium ADurb.Bin236]